MSPFSELMSTLVKRFQIIVLVLRASWHNKMLVSESFSLTARVVVDHCPHLHEQDMSTMRQPGWWWDKTSAGRSWRSPGKQCCCWGREKQSNYYRWWERVCAEPKLCGHRLRGNTMKFITLSSIQFIQCHPLWQQSSLLLLQRVTYDD